MNVAKELARLAEAARNNGVALVEFDPNEVPRKRFLAIAEALIDKGLTNIDVIPYRTWRRLLGQTTHILRVKLH